jgi:hypothetical protein
MPVLGSMGGYGGSGGWGSPGQYYGQGSSDQGSQNSQNPDDFRLPTTEGADPYAAISGAGAQSRGDIERYGEQALSYGQPYRQAGEGALSAYQASLGLGGPGALDTFRQSPGYQYALKQGLGAVSRGMGSRGLSGSGAEGRALQQTGMGLAAQDYGQYQQHLAGLAGMGAQMAGQAGQLAYGTGGQLASSGLGYAGLYSNLYGGMKSLEEKKREFDKKQSAQEAGGWGQALGSAAAIAAKFL